MSNINSPSSSYASTFNTSVGRPDDHHDNDHPGFVYFDASGRPMSSLTQTPRHSPQPAWSPAASERRPSVSSGSHASDPLDEWPSTAPIASIETDSVAWKRAIRLLEASSRREGDGASGSEGAAATELRTRPTTATTAATVTTTVTTAARAIITPATGPCCVSQFLANVRTFMANLFFSVQPRTERRTQNSPIPATAVATQVLEPQASVGSIQSLQAVSGGLGTGERCVVLRYRVAVRPALLPPPPAPRLRIVILECVPEEDGSENENESGDWDEAGEWSEQ